MQVRDFCKNCGREVPAFVWGNLLDKRMYTAFNEYEIFTVYQLQMLGSIMG
jgi:hypothetical protein